MVPARGAGWRGNVPWVTVHVEVLRDVTTEAVEAFGRLLPQLSASAAPLDQDSLGAIVEAPTNTMLIARTGGVINGPAIGAGFVFASLCDIVVAAHGATFHLNEINVGLLGASAHAVRMLGPHIARKMLFTGIPIPVEELEPLRVVDRVVPREELLDAAREIASVLAAKSPIALRLAKLSMNQSEGMPFAAGYRVEQFYTDKLLRFEDAGEARAAFNEQRAPDWKWR